MKTLFTLALISFFFISQNSFSQVSIKTGTSVSSSIPTTSTDQLRVEKGNFSQRTNGSIGHFGVSDQWIQIGKPSSDLYGMRTEWNQQALTHYLTQRPGSTIKDAVIGWGNQEGELQFRYLKDSKSSTRILSLTSQGNAFVGFWDTTLFKNPKFLINAKNQLAFAVRDSNTTAVSIINTPNNSDVNAVVPSLFIKSISKTGSGRTDGIQVSAEGGNTNYGISGNAYKGTNFNVGVFGLSKDAAINGIGVYGMAYGPGNNIGVYGRAYNGESNLAGYFAGDVFTTGTYTSSDKKLKRDIKSEGSMMDKIKNLKPVLYSYKVDEFKTLDLPKNIQHGFIAQDMKEVFPEMVRSVKDPSPSIDKSPKEEFLAINYTMLIPVLTKGLQEQQEYIEKLERRINNLENAFQKSSDQKVIDDYESLKNISIDQNIPNPFNKRTTINYSIPLRCSKASLAVFDLTGKLLMQYDNLKGRSQVVIEGNKLSAGMYIYSLIIGGKEITSKKMILTK